MSSFESRLGRLFLRYATPLAGLRRLPLVGPCVHWASALLVPRDALVWVQVQHGPAKGLWLRLNPRTGRDCFAGMVEPEVQRALAANLRSDMTFYDIGANIGFFALLGSRLVGSSGRVFTFEADPEIAARLRENVARNGLSNVTIEEKAIWSETCTVSFERADVHSSPDRGLGHVAPSSANAATVQVQATSLDDLTREAPLPDFLKVDVEGAEVEVFRGAQRLLETKHPGILCEMHSENNQRMLLQQFSRQGYVCSPCGKNRILALPQ